jgi:hypothetical protein
MRGQVIANVSGNMLPARIGCTGFAEGGALARIAATWAGAAYANAQTRSILFGAPPVSDARCLLSPCYIQTVLTWHQLLSAVLLLCPLLHAWHA